MPKPQPKPKPPIRVLVSTLVENLMEKNLDLSKSGAEWILSPQRHGEYALYFPGFSQEKVEGFVQECVDLVNGRPLHLAFWGWSEPLGHTKETLPFIQPATMPEDHWQQFRQRWTWFTTKAKSVGVKTLIMDSEIYPYTPGGNAGKMDGRAWKPSDQNEKRAKEYGEIARGIDLGTWVYWADATKHKGFAQWWKAAGLDLALPEDPFLGKSIPSNTFGAKKAPGTWKAWDRISDQELISLWRKYGESSRMVWAYDPRGLFVKDQKAVDKLGRVVARLNGLTPPG